MRITKLLPSTKIQGRWLCCLEDDSILRVGENEVVAFGLYSGMELTEDLRRELEEAVRRSDVRERALDRIAARPMSRKELVEKLTARPRDPEKPAIPTEDAEAAADWLEGWATSTTPSTPKRWPGTTPPRALDPERSGTSSSSGECPGRIGTPRWRKPRRRRTGSTPLSARS